MFKGFNEKVKGPQKKTNMLLQSRGKQIIDVNSQRVFLINKLYHPPKKG